MKLAVISDVHSNHFALESCLSYVSKINPTKILFLGDYVTGCPYPQKTMNLIYHCMEKYDCIFIKGNREEAILDYHENKKSWSYNSSSGSLLYTYDNLTAKDFEFFSDCKIARKVPLYNMPPITICHGSPSSTKDHLFEHSKLLESTLKNLDTNLILGGHIHLTINATLHGKTYINPDSVGAAIGNKPKVRFAVLHGTNSQWTPEFISLDYDCVAAAKEFNSSGLIDCAKTYAKCMQATILTGYDHAFETVMLATEYAKNDGAQVSYYNLPEKYFEIAARKFNINSIINHYL